MVIEAAVYLQPIPSRNARTGCLMFETHPHFKPNRTPEEVLRSGAFGGTYFRDIHSNVTGQMHKQVWRELPHEWIDGLDPHLHICSHTYRPDINKYGVKCGQTLEFWQDKGWIASQDPYGWFQWYCRFYQGRRTEDDDRQISRANGIMSEKGRFRNQLIRKVCEAQTTYDDERISPVIRQVLLHWGYELTKQDCEKYAKKKNWM